MSKIILTKGLPASGKTTWARQQQEKDPHLVRVNKDDLRSMLHNGWWSKNNEKMVLQIRDAIIISAIDAGRNVVVDDTNLHDKHEIKMKEIAKEHPGTKLEIKDFTDVTPEECIRRDLNRSNSVGPQVIMKMYNQFLRKRMPAPEHDRQLPNALICDIDGTLAIKGDRSPYDWKRVGEDSVNMAVLNVLCLQDLNNEPGVVPDEIILVSGRDSVCREETEKWLEENLVPYHHLYMRPEGDMRKDVVVKREIYNNHILGKYNVMFVLDDRNQVVNMWRDLGLNCFQVAEGDF